MIIVIIIIILAILFMAYYFLFARKLHSSKYITRNNRDGNFDKLMIVAHPDDELIFGGRALLQEPGWKVVCVTGATRKSNNKLESATENVRGQEFINVMDALNCAYEIWDFESFLYNANWDENILLQNLYQVISEKNYKKIVTHSLHGEYGHVQHIRISELVHALKPDNLWVFDYDLSLKNPFLERINELLKLYPTQKKIIEKHQKDIMHQTYRHCVL